MPLQSIGPGPAPGERDCGAEINFGGEREVYFVWIRNGHGGTRNLSLSGSKEQGVVRKLKGIFRPKTGDLQKKKVFTEISRDFPAEIGISSGFSNFKFTKNTNLGLDLRSKAPNLLISSGHSPRLGGTIFVWGAQAVSWGGTAPVAPPWRRVCIGRYRNSTYTSFSGHI